MEMGCLGKKLNMFGGKGVTIQHRKHHKIPVNGRREGTLGKRAVEKRWERPSFDRYQKRVLNIFRKFLGDHVRGPRGRATKIKEGGEVEMNGENRPSIQTHKIQGK